MPSYYLGTDLDYNKFKITLQKIAMDRNILEGLLNHHTSHADVHCVERVGFPEWFSMNDIFSSYGYVNQLWEKALPKDPSVVERQIARVARNGINASHFGGKAEMLNSLSTLLLANAEKITEWAYRMESLREMSFVTSRQDFTLTLTTDVEDFIGSGIGKDGKQYVTSLATVVLTGEKFNPDVQTNLPFSVRTLYPDISLHHTEGSLVQTGACFGKELREAINQQTSVCARIYWAMRAAGKDVIFHQDSSARKECVDVHEICNGVEYSARYDAGFKEHGSCQVRAQDGAFMPLKSISDPQIRAAIRTHEKQTLAPIARSALQTNLDLFRGTYQFATNRQAPETIRGCCDLENDICDIDEAKTMHEYDQVCDEPDGEER